MPNTRRYTLNLPSIYLGIFGIGVVSRINKEIQTKHLDGLTKCKAGLEVHFKEGRSCGESTKVNKRRKRAGCRRWHVICWASELS